MVPTLPLHLLPPHVLKKISDKITIKRDHSLKTSMTEKTHILLQIYIYTCTNKAIETL